MSEDFHKSERLPEATEIKSRQLDLQNQMEIEQRIAAQERRKLKAKQEKHHTVWFGLGMFGLIGWSVAIPAVAGAAIGLWIDSNWPSRFSWSLMLLIGGLALGCFNAWKWLHREGNIDQ
ncbi:MAG: AtpZ/AtpI family protein [Planctomycetaceae bacterium]|nr:AtpZ/AtpI family protein [Planctomycetaceae bacterium]